MFVRTSSPTNQNLKSRTHTVSPYGVCANIKPALVILERSVSEVKNLARKVNKKVSLPLKRTVGDACPYDNVQFVAIIFLISPINQNLKLKIQGGCFACRFNVN